MYNLFQFVNSSSICFHFLWFMILLRNNAHGSCPDGFRPFQDKACFYYKGFTVDNTTWSDAKAACSAQSSSTLASVDNSEQELWLVNEFMSQNVKSNPPTGQISAWIGLVRARPLDSCWVWEDGSTSQYRNWGATEPNNYRNVEDCTQIWVTFPNKSRKYSWYDAVCQPTVGNWFHSAGGYFCRLPYTKDDNKETGNLSVDGKYSDIARANVALSITVTVLLAMVILFAGWMIWYHREKIVIHCPFIMFRRSVSTEQLKEEHY